jgi:ubiquinone/menaquinone biosynthesis C-methylase UbiE
MQSSRELAEQAGITSGAIGVDLCCYTGAGMRYLVRFHGVAQMVGVDATPGVVERGRARCAEEGFANQITFVLADACASGLPDESADFIWGEDAWCYVRDKARLVEEAARIVRPGGVIAFTDWVEGPSPMHQREAERLMRFMSFPTILDLESYKHLLENTGCRVETAKDTSRFAPYADLYRSMITMQLTYDALRLAGYDQERMRALEQERDFLRDIAHQSKLIQGLVVARKPG